ncbi:MAG: acyl-CoA dehydrogenase [Microthrixaceae bacterium]
MADYRTPKKDLLFALRTAGMIDELSSRERFAHSDYDTVAGVFEEHSRFFEEVWAPTNENGDREGLEWSEDGVTTPESFKDAWAKYVKAGWQGMNLDPDYGGMGFPEVVYSLGAEAVIGSNAALSMLPGLTTGAVELLQHWGTEEQKERSLPKMISGEWSGTMNLTEPQAGSDVGLSTTKAVPRDDGSYLLTGTKIFISFGEHDLTENIIHLVLARTPDAPAGTRGISLFLVPKFLLDEDGNPAERNDVRCVSIEHKMGIHASPTCVLSYGDEGGAVGWLVGEECQGLNAMFTMMNAARLAVGVQGTGIAEAAYQKAVDYAAERVQGREIGSDEKGAVPIIRHPDVRRMLLGMKARIEATRNLTTHLAACIDMANSTEGDDSQGWDERVELLTPVAKAWCTDVGVEVTSTALQVFGGMGYIEESGVAQHFRDQRITPIYEGTNGIQAMDLVGRKLPIRAGAAFTDLVTEMRRVLGELEGIEELTATREALSAAFDELDTATGWIMEHGLADPRDALAGATPYLELVGLTAGGWLMARQALAARNELDQGAADGKEYLEAKVTSARFFCEQVMPKVHSLTPAVTAGHGILYEIDAEALASS